MPSNPTAVYLQLRNLMASMPPLEGRGRYTDAQYLWLGKVPALSEHAGGVADKMSINVAITNLMNTTSRELGYRNLMFYLHQAPARAELAASAEMQGAFIDVGWEFTDLQGVTRVVSAATSAWLIVDPYLS